MTATPRRPGRLSAGFPTGFPSGFPAGFLALAALAQGCPAPPPHQRARSHGVPTVSTDPTDAAAVSTGTSEIAPELTARVTACAARLGSTLAPELSAALGAMDDDTLLTDACRLELAVSARAPGLCDTVSLGPLRAVCAARAAMATARPDLCPAALGLRGHDPTCVAIAARAPRLCVAANVTDQGRCLALAAANPRACDGLDPLIRPACTRDLAALSRVLPPLRTEALREGSVGALVVTEAGDASVPLEYALHTCARGALLGDDGALWLVDSTRGWPSALATADDRPVPGVRILLAGTRPGVDLPAEARVLLPGGAGAMLDGAMLDTAAPPTTATARFATVPRGLGSAVRVVVTVTGIVHEARVRVVLDVDTFVRDLTPAAGLR